MTLDLHIIIALLAGHVLGEVLWDRIRATGWRRFWGASGVLVASYIALGAWAYWPVVVMAGVLWGVVRGVGAATHDEAAPWVATQLGAVALIIFGAWGAQEGVTGTPVASSWPLPIHQVIAGAVGLVATVWLGGIFVNLAIRPFAQQMKGADAVEAGGRVIEPLENGFKDGGRVIGLYERLLIFVFVIAGAPAAIGFLVAAKSLFRFGDLKDDQNRKIAEYIIIGTLMSFAYALVVAYGTRTLLTVLGGAMNS